MREELRPVATRNVIGSLVLYEVANNEKIEVSDTEIDAEIDGMAKGAAEDKREEVRKLLDAPQTRGSIRQSLMTRKTMERLVEIAKGSGETKTEAKEEKNE